MWPILLCINELPYTQRFQSKNILLAGLWYGKEKPQMSAFMKPVTDMLMSLERGTNYSLTLYSQLYLHNDTLFRNHCVTS